MRTNDLGREPASVEYRRAAGMRATTLAVIAKAPQPGRSKTRLCPPCTPAQAAALAEAALRDTLAALLAAACERRVLVLEGTPGPWLPAGIEVIAQRGAGLDERLAAAFEDIGAPAFLVGMDTPQLTAADLEAGLDALSDHDAVLGPAPDGGYWGVGLNDTPTAVFTGVPMSADNTLDHQRARLRELGMDCRLLHELCDVDTFDDALTVAAGAPRTRFAQALARLDVPEAVA